MARIFLGGATTFPRPQRREAGAEGSLHCILRTLLVCLAASQLGGGTLDTALNTGKEEESSTYWPALPRYPTSPEFVPYD